MAATDGNDRISSLPNEILLHVLSFLPMQPSVQTSILSSRWRDLWKFNPVIDFSDLPSYSLVDDALDSNETPDYSFVSGCLELNRASKLKRFAIHWCSYHWNPYAFFNEFENWVAMVAAKHVEELQLAFYSSDRIPMSPALCAAKTIKNLHLSGFCFGSPSGFNNLVLLEDLHIEYSRLGDKVVEEIVSSCPLLENLTLKKCNPLYKVKIAGPSLRLKHLVFVQGFLKLEGLELEAPNLVFFKYEGCIVPFCLRHLHCLAQIDLFFEAFVSKPPPSSFNEELLVWTIGGALIFEPLDDTRIGYAKTTMDQLSHVEILHVTAWFLQFVAKAYDSVGNRCFLAFQNLKTFVWSGMLKTKEELFSLVAFLGDCPSLELLKMEFNCSRGVPMQLEDEEPCFVIEGEEPKIRVGCLYQLRKIELHRFEGRPCETELIKLLFENAVVLDTLSVNFASCVSELHTEELIEQISLYPIGSSQAQVIFCKENYVEILV